MIAKKSIDQIREEASLLKVAELLIPDLKQRGANYEAPCPFPSHVENTPSFHLSTSKNIYKCFGCGKGGKDVIRLAMDVKQLDFVAAVRYLAGEFNIELEETEQTEEAKQEQLQRQDYIRINRQVADLYRKNFIILQSAEDHPQNGPIDEVLMFRQLQQETIDAFEIGYALNEFKQITPFLVNQNLYEAGVALDLIKTKEGSTNTYDVLRNRIIFPIHNELGEVVGFGGRALKNPDAKPDEKEPPKYLNSPESIVYKKDRILYGLYQAAPFIRQMGFACVVEGYFDVTSFYQTGLPNTVAPCGTALTEHHAKLLKRFTQTVVLIGDADAAGQKANLRSTDILLAEGLKVEIVILPEKHDPDSFARRFQYIPVPGELDLKEDAA